MIQVYTALTIQGPGLVKRINDELDALLAADGFKSVADAVGADHRAQPQDAAIVKAALKK